MKKATVILILILFIFSGCSRNTPAQIAATTLPVHEFTELLCQGTGIAVTRLVTENVSCLHDYSLQVGQMRSVEKAEVVILSGAGLEGFLDDTLHRAAQIIDASSGIELLCGHEHRHEDHHHEEDPHIWLSPENAKLMCQNICEELIALYPQHQAQFLENLDVLLEKLDALQQYGETALQNLSKRELITFHDGFAYFAESFDLHILKAVEEESGSEASAKALIELIDLVERHNLSAVFTETNGSTSAAQIISKETGAKIFTLDMAMSGNSYFDAMYYNINTIKEALG